MRTLGRARLTITASASCMSNFQSINDPRKQNKIRYRHDYGKQLAFLLHDQRRDAAINTPLMNGKRNQSQFEESRLGNLDARNQINFLSEGIASIILSH